MKDTYDMVNKMAKDFHRKHAPQVTVDVNDELQDLLKVYSEATDHLEKKHYNAMERLIGCMRAFLEVIDEYRDTRNKLDRLKSKLGNDKHEEEEDE